MERLKRNTSTARKEVVAATTIRSKVQWNEPAVVGLKKNVDPRSSTPGTTEVMSAASNAMSRRGATVRHRALFWASYRASCGTATPAASAVRYGRSLHPIAQLAIFAFVFAAIFRSRAGILDESQFIAFYAAGLWPWLAFREGLARGTRASRTPRPLIKKIAFPNELVVGAAVTATFIVHLGGFALALVALKSLRAADRLHRRPGGDHRLRRRCSWPRSGCRSRCRRSS